MCFRSPRAPEREELEGLRASGKNMQARGGKKFRTHRGKSVQSGVTHNGVAGGRKRDEWGGLGMEKVWVERQDLESG